MVPLFLFTLLDISNKTIKMTSIREQIVEALKEFSTLPHYTSGNGKKYFTIDDVIRDGVEIKDLKKVSEKDLVEKMVGRKVTDATPLNAEEFQPFVELMIFAWGITSNSRSYVFRKLGMSVKWLKKDAQE